MVNRKRIIILQPPLLEEIRLNLMMIVKLMFKVVKELNKEPLLKLLKRLVPGGNFIME